MEGMWGVWTLMCLGEKAWLLAGLGILAIILLEWSIRGKRKWYG
jgi:hypothetical protein